MSISPSLSPRQCPDRYAFRAGRNLPDKEFRYLRTVIVTAAVYRGFDSRLSPLLLTFRHRAGVRPYTSSLDFAQPCVFTKQSPPPALCHPRRVAPDGSRLSRSYASNLPSSFGIVLSSASACSASPPVSVSGTVHPLALFPGTPRHARALQQARTKLRIRHVQQAGECSPPFPSATALALALGADLPYPD